MRLALLAGIACLVLANAAGAGTAPPTPFSGTWWVIDAGGGGLEEASFADRELDFAESSARACGGGALSGWEFGSVNGNTWTGSADTSTAGNQEDFGCDNENLRTVDLPSVQFTANPDGTLSSSLTPSSEHWTRAMPLPPPPNLRPTATTTTGYDSLPITLLSADGSRVAFVADIPILWDPATGFRSGSLDGDGCMEGVADVAVAGVRVESLCLDSWYSNRWRGLDLGWATHRRPGSNPAVWRRLSSAAYDCAPSCLANLAGSGNLLVYNTYRTRAAKKDPGHWWVWRIAGSHRVLVTTSAQPLAIVAVDRGRIFVRQFNRLLVLDPFGRILASYPSPGPGPVAVDGDNLVAQTPTGVNILDLGTGSITYRWTLPAHAVLRDMNSHTFVYTVGRAFHLHRLTTGADEAFPLKNVNGPIEAQLTDAGLFYSWNLGQEQGFLDFVPTDRLPARFR
jgi:hypothetical protein